MSIHKLAIIEDDPEIREMYSDILNTRNDLLVVQAYPDCEQAILTITTHNPDIILMDIDLPGINGVEGTKRIKKLLPEVKIIIVTVIENSKTVFEALCAGAVGYISKNSDKEKLLNVIDEALKGGAPMSTHIAKMVVESFHINHNTPLSNRETEVLSLLSENKSYGDIANILFISKDTVKFHIRNIYQKLQVNNRADAIEKANKDKLI